MIVTEGIYLQDLEFTVKVRVSMTSLIHYLLICKLTYERTSSFIYSLIHAQQEFTQELQRREILTHAELNAIFSNLTQIYEFHQMLMKEIEGIEMLDAFLKMVMGCYVVECE